MHIDHFDDLLAMARSQPTPQQLLLVFVRAELPDDADEAQRQAFEQGSGGALTPVFCVDKAASALPGFAALCQEAEALGQPWDLVLVAALSAAPGRPLDEAQIQATLERLVAGVQAGDIGPCLPFDRAGVPLQMA